MLVRSRQLLVLPSVLACALAGCGTRGDALPEPPPPSQAIVFHDEGRARTAGAISEYLRQAGFKTRTQLAALTTEPARRVLIYGREELADRGDLVRASLRDFPELAFRRYPTPGPEGFEVVVWIIGEERPATPAE